MNYLCVVYHIYILFYVDYMILKYDKSHEINNIPLYRFNVISFLDFSFELVCVVGTLSRVQLSAVACTSHLCIIYH